jgi:hypothetical protein
MLNTRDFVPKRPISVWIAQILMAIIACGFFLIGIFVLMSVRFAPAGLFSLVIGLVFASLPITAFIGMAMRRQYGRWIAVGVLLLLVLNSFVRIFTDPNVVGSTSGSFKMGYLVGNLLPNLLLVWLVFVLIKSDAVCQFFDSAREANVEPPPIESYDLSIKSD